MQTTEHQYKKKLRIMELWTIIHMDQKNACAKSTRKNDDKFDI